MTDYISREAAIEKIREIESNYRATDDFDEAFVAEFCGDAVEDLPAADVAEVVRCKDCRFWRKNEPYDGYGWCQNQIADLTDRNENFFCAVAVREEQT